MNGQINTPTAASASTATVMTSPSKLSKYEDCIPIIEAAIATPEVKGKDEALTRLLTFFRDRLARKASQDEKDGTAAVKRTILAGRPLFTKRDAIPTDRAS
jgi:hypothetical protein